MAKLQLFGFEQNYTVMGAVKLGTVPFPASTGTMSMRSQFDTYCMPYMLGAEFV
jgi:hypothetical protein